MPASDTKSISIKLEGYSLVELVDRMASWATQNCLPFIVYRLPGDEHFNFQIGSSITQIADNDLSGLEAGFLFSTYDGDNYFIDKGLSLNSKNRQIEISNTWPTTISLESLAVNEESWLPYTIDSELVETKAEEYIENVKKCINKIKGSNLIKVVPSRTKRVKLNQNQSLGRVFINLSKKYNNAFVSILSTQEFGTWIGATPESIIEVDEDGIFKTMSLAGTQAYNGVDPLHSLPWTQKEIEEQAMVSRYIINRFKEIRLREFEEVGPRTVDAGNMAHLCSTFTVNTKATGHDTLGSVMLKLLHPTSAVCGMPKPEAQKLLDEIENHHRKLFAGYLGPVNMENGSHIYVNLRCMEVIGNEGLLYAGAGVTAYSNAEEEWLETELKCNTLLNIIEA